MNPERREELRALAFRLDQPQYRFELGIDALAVNSTWRNQYVRSYTHSFNGTHFRHRSAKGGDQHKVLATREPDRHSAQKSTPRDKSLTAQFEHTLVVTERGADILTLP